MKVGYSLPWTAEDPNAAIPAIEATPIRSKRARKQVTDIAK
jgi:hypothetical protein